MNLRKLALGAIAASFVFIGCDNTNPFAAQLPTSEDVFTIFALTGTPPAYPSGYDTYGRSPTRVDGNASFDVAFDITSDGNAILYPVKLVVSSVSGDRPVGLRLMPGTFDSTTFDSIKSAPTGTYQTDSAVVASRGQIVIVESNRGISGDVCSLSLSQNIYTKIFIDSVDVALRTIKIHTVMDPNCGFRSFEVGIPGS